MGPVGDVKENSGYSVSVIQLSNVRNDAIWFKKRDLQMFARSTKTSCSKECQEILKVSTALFRLETT